MIYLFHFFNNYKKLINIRFQNTNKKFTKYYKFNLKIIISLVESNRLNSILNAQQF